ncbi:hypothetical protein B1207_06135 [Legionella quinlivanii]|uniref:Uncharacterized protein n=1 Tax=Legionella quinlivanii TaxID=45073 RepID=A0A364LK75_9GAMM|nr:hypothetical protein [Legionella quinlivanii]RAP37006.1 hypothetical protein B1207_06135 [Legionella quinlivanii]
MTFLVTYLGTDTEHTQDTNTFYPRGESLSGAANAVAGTLRDKLVSDKVEHLVSDQQILIDGPTTLGTEVGDRIARGVLAMIDALSRGEKDFAIAAHSRGAVQGILSAHEMERIQNLFKQDPLPANLIDEIKKSPCPYTRAAFNTTQLSERLGKINLENVGKHIQDAKISMFTIDPVPGGRYHGAPVAWVDPRFYRIPAIVKHYEQYVYQNERTRCFKAIVPACDSPDTVFKLTSLPGHHGTGSGNAKDQQFREVPKEKGVTTHVQDLLVLKLLDFYRRNNVEFKSDTDLKDAPISEEMKELISPLLALRNDPAKYKARLEKEYLAAYSEIVKNREAYKHFDNTGYAVLGQEQGIWALFGLNKNDRIIHYQGHNDTFLSTVVSEAMGENFLNYEHAQLYLNDLLKLGEDSTLAAMIENASRKFSVMARHVHQLSQPQLISESVHQDQFALALKETQGQELLSDALKFLIREVSEAYLNNEFKNAQERGEVFNAVSQAFATFTEAGQKYPLAANILDELQKGLKATLQTKQGMLIEQSSKVFKEIDRFHHLDALFKQLEPVLKLDNAELKEIQAILRQMQQEISSAREQQFSASKLALLTETYYMKLDAYRTGHSSPQALPYIDQINMLMLETLENQRAESTSVERKILESLETYRALEDFIRGLDDFQEFNLDLDLKEMQRELSDKQAILKQSTADYIFKEKIPLEKVEAICGETNKAFYSNVAYQAIALGTPDPALLAKEKEVEQQYERVGELEKVTARLQQKIEEQQASLAQNEELIAEQEGKINQRDQHIGIIEEELKKQSAVLEVNVTALGLEKAANTQLKAKYNDIEEAQCLILIEKKLSPLTQNYLQHLWKDIQKQAKSNEPFPNNWRQALNKDYPGVDHKLLVKFSITVNLLEKLNDRESTPDHSERVSNFYTMLDSSHKSLSQHRDERWNHFVAKAVVFVVATGILPGLAILGIMALAKGHSLGQSSGHAFFKTAREEITKSNPELIEEQSLDLNPGANGG